MARTIALTSLESPYAVGPAEGRKILIGRNTDEVHVVVGAGDRAVSRHHVVLRCSAGRWWARRLGRREVRLGTGRRLWREGDAVALEPGYTSLVVDGSSDPRLPRGHPPNMSNIRNRVDPVAQCVRLITSLTP